ncbi:MAG: hypothetical protein KJ042_16565 [Deltaproteobacteria bacterium]|nr:hypothetical protein [Deltaproteobacteria bacterium]
MSIVRSRTALRVLVLASCLALLAAPACRSGGDDDDDDNHGGGGPGGFAGGGDETCGRVFALGDGIAERVDGVWNDITPDIFESSWTLADAARLNCDEFVFAGRDNARQAGIVLRSLKGAFARDEIPPISTSFDFAAVHSRAGLTLAAGGDWESRTGFVLRESGGAWMRESLPAVSPDWWLTDVQVLGKDRAAALGFDRANSRSILLNLKTGVWSLETIPLDGVRLAAFELTDADNGLAVGRSASGTGGAIAWRSAGTWYSATSPVVSADWLLSDIAYAGKGVAIVVGRSYDLGAGVALEWSDGAIGVAALPTVTASWDLRAACSPGEPKTDLDTDALAAGADREGGGGIVLKRAGGMWSLDALLPFAPGALAAF